MASDWKLSTLEEAGVVLIDCVHKTPPATDQGYPYIGIPQIKNGCIDFSLNPRLISYSDYKKWTIKADPKADDIVLSRRCNPGETAYVPQGVEFALGQNLVLLRSVGYKIYPPFLRWLVRGPEWWAQVGKYLNVGAVFDSLRCGEIPRFELLIPPLSEQKAIAHILGSLDDKIELNRQMNETLEAMAQALFKSWFVDFDPVIDNALAAGKPIPDEFIERAEQRKAIEKKDNSDIQNLFPDEFEFTEEMGWIPKGWGFGMLADICFFGKGKINTSELSLENYVSTENMNKEKAGISYAASIASTSQVPKFSVGQTLISNIRPYFKKIWLASFSGGRSNDVLGFQANNAVANEYLFSLLYQDSFFDYMTATSKGTKMPRGDKAAIMSWSVAIPPLILMEEFSNKVKPMYLANNIHSKQAISLSELRDTLLPKLMSGELRIPDDIV